MCKTDKTTTIHDFGLQCPMCSSVYSANIDVNEPLPEGASMAHCPRCKARPAMNLITRYKVRDVTLVKKYPKGD